MRGTGSSASRGRRPLSRKECRSGWSAQRRQLLSYLRTSSEFDDNCARIYRANGAHFKTHKGDAAHQPSHIDYILISSRSVSAIKAFGIAAPAELMIDYDHSVLFCDLDVTQLLELGTRKPAPDLPQRHKSQIRYSDKKRVARFRTYAANLYDKQGVAEKIQALIGDLELNDTLTELGREEREAEAAKGWDTCH